MQDDIDFEPKEAEDTKSGGDWETVEAVAEEALNYKWNLIFKPKENQENGARFGKMLVIWQEKRLLTLPLISRQHL